MEIRGSTCSNCSRTIVPDRETCPYCGPGERMLPVLLGNRGLVLSYTILEMPPKGFNPPVLLAMVELDKGAAILALADKSEIENVKINTPVSIHHDNEGRFMLSVDS